MAIHNGQPQSFIKAAGTDGANLAARPRSEIATRTVDEALQASAHDTPGIAAHLDPVARGAGQASGSEIAAPGVMDRALGAADKMVSIGGWLPMVVGGAQMGTNAAMWAGNKIGRFTGLRAADTAASKAASKSWNAITFKQIGESTGMGGAAGKMVQGGADMIAKPTDWLLDKIKVRGWRKSVNAAKAAKNFDKAQDMLGQLSAADTALPAMQDLKTVVGRASNAGSLAASGKVEGLITAAREAQEGGKLSAAAGRFVNAAEDSILHHESATMWGDVRGAIKAAPSKLGKSSATHTIMNASFIGMSALSMFGDARTFKQNLDSLRQMYADMTGEDVTKISTAKLLMGKVPDAVAAARSHLIKQFGIKQLFDVGNIALNVAMVFNRKFNGAKAMGAMIGTQMASTAVDGMMGESILPIHKAFSDAYKKGQEIPPEFYSSYIYAASKELRSRGDKGQQFADQLAQEYAAERIAPGKLLNEIQDGKMIERIKRITAQADHAAGQAQAAPVAEAAAALPVKERPVLGKFTGKLNQEGQMAGVGQAIP